MMRTYWIGWMARWDNGFSWQCPYEDGTEEATAWLEGFRYADTLYEKYFENGDLLKTF